MGWVAGAGICSHLPAITEGFKTLQDLVYTVYISRGA